MEICLLYRTFERAFLMVLKPTFSGNSLDLYLLKERRKLIKTHFVPLVTSFLRELPPITSLLITKLNLALLIILLPLAEKMVIRKA